MRVNPAALLIGAAAMSVLYAMPARLHGMDRTVFITTAIVVAVGVAMLAAGYKGHLRWVREAPHRVGVRGLEILGLVSALGLAAVAVATAPQYLPLAFACAAGFVMAMTAPTRLRPVEPYRPSVIVVDVPQVGNPDEYVTRSFAWTLDLGDTTHRHTHEALIRRDLYQQMKDDNPGHGHTARGADWMPWIVDGSSGEVARAALEFNRTTVAEGYSSFGEISNVLAFVQSIRYSLDVETTGREEYWRYPIETLHDQVGDCEDTVILAAAVLRHMGHRVGVLVGPNGDTGHAALAVEAPSGVGGTYVERGGRRYYYAETTGQGWIVGQIPEDLDLSEWSLTVMPELPIRESPADVGA
jgi:predicted transglutaminase-like cysteine proteinase